MKTSLLKKGRSYRKKGQLNKALNIYNKMAMSSNDSVHDIGIYMQAFTYVMLAHQVKHGLDLLGADLRSTPSDPYTQACRYLNMIKSSHFNPKQHGLPLLKSYELNEIKRHGPIKSKETHHCARPY